MDSSDGKKQRRRAVRRQGPPADAPASTSGQAQAVATEGGPEGASRAEGIPETSAGMADTSASGATAEGGASAAEPAPGKRSRLRRFARAGALALVPVVIVALLAACGFFLWQRHEQGQLEAKRADYINVAKQEVLNTLNLHEKTAKQDVQRILDGATGPFYDQFNGGKDQFVDVVQKAKVNSSGDIVAAALQGIEGNSAKVLVVGTSQVSNSASPQPTERDYRLRVTVTDTGSSGMKVSDIEYVMS